MTNRISIIGAHGQIARQLTRILVERGHEVRGLVRSDEQFDDLLSDGSEPVLCDLESATSEDMNSALDGSSIVVFAAGSGPGSGPERKRTLDRDGAIKSVDAAIRIGARRFVIVSSMGAGDPPEDDETFSVYLRAKHDADAAVRRICEEAGCSYTIVRPGKLTDDDPTGAVQVSISADRGEIPRADVAEVLAELIHAEQCKDTTFEVVSGDQPIPAALQAYQRV